MKKFFFDNRKNNIYDFIFYCWKNPRKQYLKKDLYEKLNLSPAVLEGILQEAKELYENYSELSIINEQQTVKIIFGNAFTLNKMYIMLFKKTLGFKFLCTLFEEKFVSLEVFADDNFVSSRTVQRQLKSLEDLLKLYGLELALKKKELIIGEEYRIRHFFLAIFWHTYEEGEDFYRKYQPEYEQFEGMIDKRTINLIPAELKKIFLLARITKWRLKKGYNVEYLPLSITEVRHPSCTRQYFKDQFVNKFFTGRYLLNEEEISYFYYMFTIIPSYMLEYLDKVNHLENFFNHDYQILTNSIMNNFYELTNIKLTQREEKFISLNIVYQASYYLSFGSTKNTISFSDAEYFLFSEKRRKHIHELSNLLAQKVPLK
ncbi:MAG: helix-turn-helix domain-containing protein, partial [Streptococcaceae bacterium]|nr:helix-turn-helix domain-containing protein [Streptococcaceae bacterium]